MLVNPGNLSFWCGIIKNKIFFIKSNNLYVVLQRLGKYYFYDIKKQL